MVIRVQCYTVLKEDVLREKIKVEISYTTSPLSEYIGSYIYESIGIPVHVTKLGIKDGKVVVAYKDFREMYKYQNKEMYNSQF